MPQWNNGYHRRKGAHDLPPNYQTSPANDLAGQDSEHQLAGMQENNFYLEKAARQLTLTLTLTLTQQYHSIQSLHYFNTSSRQMETVFGKTLPRNTYQVTMLYT